MNLLIDTDPGVDDALAILMALADPGVRLLGLSIAAGNVGLGHTTRNALKLLEVAGRDDVPVFAGSPLPLLPTDEHAAFVHGRDGFGDTACLPPRRAASDEHAVHAILRLSREVAGDLTLVALAPLTNVALALRLDPELPTRVSRLVVMGGAVTGRGNLERRAVEFNFGFDPEAAAMVMEAFPRIELVDWEATLAHAVDESVFLDMMGQDNHRARFYRAIFRRTLEFQRRFHPGHVHSADALAMAVVLEPEAVEEVSERAVWIETGGRDTRGMSMVDWERHSARPPRTRIVTRVTQSRFEARLASALA
ncbi:MAG TPA: nucleoside hydrolase [Xanthomonadaceae bacterium]|nr:nucleoside hydrolase [Xanthomonadaceae bacterium]